MLSPRTTRILKNNLPHTLWNALIPDKEFWDAQTTEDQLSDGGYFTSKPIGQPADVDSSMDVENDGSTTGLPAAIKEAQSKPLAMSALGALIWYLRSVSNIQDTLVDTYTMNSAAYSYEQ